MTLLTRSGRPAALPHARGRAAAAGRRRHVRRGPAPSVEDARSRPTSATGSRWPCAACWSSIPTAWCWSTPALGNKEDAQVPRHLRRRERRDSKAPPSSRMRWPTAGFLPRDVQLGDQHPPALRPRRRQHHAWTRSWRTTRAGTCGPTFPNATYVVQRGELEFARHTNERTRASYLPHNFEPIAAADRWRLLDGDGEVLPGISVRLTPGPRAVPPVRAGAERRRDGGLRRAI